MKAEKFTFAGIDAALGGARGYTREDRVRFLMVAALALIRGKPVPRDAALFLGGALLYWLVGGKHVGDLEKVFLKVTAGRSRVTPQAIYARLSAHPDDVQDQEVSIGSIRIHNDEDHHQ